MKKFVCLIFILLLCCGCSSSPKEKIAYCHCIFKDIESDVYATYDEGGIVTSEESTMRFTYNTIDEAITMEKYFDIGDKAAEFDYYNVTREGNIITLSQRKTKNLNLSVDEFIKENNSNECSCEKDYNKTVG